MLALRVTAPPALLPHTTNNFSSCRKLFMSQEQSRLCLHLAARPVITSHLGPIPASSCCADPFWYYGDNTLFGYQTRPWPGLDTRAKRFFRIEWKKRFLESQLIRGAFFLFNLFHYHSLLSFCCCCVFSSYLLTCTLQLTLPCLVWLATSLSIHGRLC